MELPDEVTADELAQDVRDDLRSLSKETADRVARHLVMAGMLIDDEPEAALAHARAARASAGRVGAVREANGLAAYHAGEYAEALAELRAARRIDGSNRHIAVMADAERGVGRPERALALATDPASATGVDAATRAELRIVEAGARRDLGQADAAVLALQAADLGTARRMPWGARLLYAYADALEAAGRPADARKWFAVAAEADEAEDTDALERLAALQSR